VTSSRYPLITGGRGLADPDRVQHGQVVDIRQVAPQYLSRRQFLPVPTLPGKNFYS
jgi:hypothetical protein